MTVKVNDLFISTAPTESRRRPFFVERITEAAIEARHFPREAYDRSYWLTYQEFSDLNAVCIGYVKRHLSIFMEEILFKKESVDI